MILHFCKITYKGRVSKGSNEKDECRQAKGTDSLYMYLEFIDAFEDYVLIRSHRNSEKLHDRCDGHQFETAKVLKWCDINKCN